MSRDITLEDTIYGKFTTRTVAGVPFALASGTLSVYEQDNLTQITAGVSISVDYDSVTGLNQYTVVATAANGYELSKSYDIVVTVGTVNSVSVVGEVVDSFTIGSSAAAVDLANTTDGLGAIKDAVDNVGASSGGAFPFAATSDNATVAIEGVSSVGTPTGTFVNTEAADAVLHTITHDTNDIDWIYGFNVGGARTAVEVSFDGYLNSANDAMLIQAFDFVGSDWETITPLSGKGGSTNDSIKRPLLGKHTGTGADLGNVYIRFEADGVMTSPVLNTDGLIVSAVNKGESVGYANGAVWGKIGSGVAGTLNFTNGVADNKSNTFADMLTIADSVGLDDFEFTPSSSVTLAAAINTGRVMRGNGWILALGGQDVNNLHVFGANVSGVGTGATAMGFHNCFFTTSSLQKAKVFESVFQAGTTTLTLAGDYNFNDCRSGVAGMGAHTFAKTAGQAITAQWRDYQGSLTFSGLEVGDTLTVGGKLGTIDLGSPAGAVAVEVRGSYKEITNIGSAAVNLAGAWIGADIASTLVDTGEIGTAGAGLTNIDLPNQTMDIVGDITGDLSGSVGSVTAATTVGTINTDVIDAASLNADAVTEIVVGVWNAARATYMAAGSMGETHAPVINGAAATGTLSATQATSDLTAYADDELIGRTIYPITGNRAGEATDITDYANASGLITFTAMTGAMANGDRFLIY